jgi:hypothetical protein
LLKSAGLLKTRSTPDGELIDYEASEAIAMVDHQIAHVYVRQIADVRKVHEALRHDDITIVAPVSLLAPNAAITHARAGYFQLQARTGTWFDYRWWENPSDAPSFATMVDIHRKPGYDPLELFLEPGTRTITQNAELIRGSHGSVPGSDGLLIGASDGQMVPLEAFASRILPLLEG